MNINNGQRVCIHYTGRHADGKVFDSSVERESPLYFVAGSGALLPNFEQAVCSMQVGEKKSLGTIRGNIQGEIPMKGGLEGYSVDEAKARASSVRLNSKPYSIFGQVIAGDINQGLKQTFDANLSLFEEQVKNAIKNNEDPTEFIRKYNKRVKYLTAK